MNEKGISLVSVTIAAGLMGMLAVFMMKMQENQLKTQNDMLARTEIGQFMSTLNNTMAKPGYCENNLRDVEVGPDKEVEITKLLTPKGDILYEVGEKYGQGHFTLKSIQQKEFSFDTDDESSGFLTLNITFEKNKKAFGTKEVYRDFVIMVQIDEGRVYDCSTLGGVGNSSAARVDMNSINNVVNTDESSEAGKEQQGNKEEEVKRIIDNNSNLKMMQEAIQSIKETNEKFKKLEERYREEDNNNK